MALQENAPAIIESRTVESGDRDSNVKSPDQLAWNRTDKYVAPRFADYFPEYDETAVERLNEFMNIATFRTQHPDEFIDVVRRGLRSTKLHKTSVLRTMGNTFIWGRQPQNEKAIELMYHAAGADEEEVVHYAMYFGLTVVNDRSDNLMRMMMTNHDRFDPGIQKRLNWSFRNYGDKAVTARQLEQLLDEHETLDDLTTIAIYDYYKNLMGNPPPNAERFAELGKWAIGFSHQDVTSNQPDGFQQLRDMLGQYLELADEQIVEYVSRLDGVKWVGVTLVDGIALKEGLVDKVQNTEGFKVEFVEQLDRRLFQTRRLREFAKHWEGDVSDAAPEYVLPEAGRVFVWNRPDKYESPSYDVYFPDDVEAGKRLDEMIQLQIASQLSDREILDAFRKGLKRSDTPANQKLSFLSSVLGWPTDPYQTEIMFHAAALDAPEEVQYYAVYYGLGIWWDKSDNILRLLADLMAHPVRPGNHLADDLHRRILWSVTNREREKASLAEYLGQHLERHAELDDATLVRLVQTYRKLTGEQPAGLSKFDQRGVFVVVWRRSDAKNALEYERYFDSLRKNVKETKSIGLHVREHKGGFYSVAIIGGITTHESFVKLLQEDDNNSIEAAMPWPQPWDLKNGLPGPAELDELEFGD